MKEILIIGLGPGKMAHLSCGAWDALRSGAPIFLRTDRHPAVAELAARGLTFRTFDELYEQKDSFEEVYRTIADNLLEAVHEIPGNQIIYAVPGNPLVAEESVRLLLSKAEERGVRATLIPGMSFLDTMLSILKIDPEEGLLFLNALDFKQGNVNPCLHLVFTQVYSRMVASDLKLTLLEIYPPEHPAVIIRAAGIPDEERIWRGQLWEMDHHDWFNHLTSVYVEPERGRCSKTEVSYPLDPLMEVMDILLSPRGCPWDREQDHISLKPYLIEEVYEVIEAIDSGEMHNLQEELGDLLLQIVFHALLAEKRGDFTANDVIRGITEKMIRRHPHVFGDVSVSDSTEVLRNWEQIKSKEKGEAPKPARVLGGLNRSLPALLLAEEVQKKAAKVGFDWPEAQGAWDKLQEEIKELKKAWNENTNIEEEMGDLLFSAVNLCRFFKISPEAALYKTIRKFILRFNYIEDRLGEKGTGWGSLKLSEIEKIWLEAKNNA